MRGRYNQFEENDLVAYVKNLTRRIEDLEKGAGIGSTAIDAGDLSILGGSLTVGPGAIVYMGPGVFGGDNATTWIFRRYDGTTALSLTGTSSGNQNWQLLDNAQNVVVSDDDSDQGLARPYLPINFELHSSTVPTVTTTSGTFVPLFTGRYLKQHPRAEVEVLANASTGATSGEVQLYNVSTGLVIDGPRSIGLGFYGSVILGPATVDGGFLSTQEIEIQARRTAGAGTIGIRVLNAYGVES